MPPEASTRPAPPAGAAAAQTAPREIEHLFQVSLFLLIVTGFGALAATGKLDLLSLAIVFVALTVRGVFLLRDRPVNLPRRAIGYLSVGYIFFFALDYFFFSGRDFVSPAVHLVLFGICIKLFSIERDRDYIYLALLAFLMVLSAAILTVDSAFLGTFALFLVLAVFWFMAAELRRSAKKSANTAPLIIPGLLKRRRALSPLERLTASLLRTSLVLVAAIVVLATLLFFAIPRVNGGYISRQAQSDAISTGFSDSVTLGVIGHIEQSPEVVAHVQIEGDTTGTRILRLRGAVLSHFDGRRWSNPRGEANVISRSFGHQFRIGLPDTPLSERNDYRRARGPEPNLIHYRVLMEPLSTSVIFTIPVTQALFGSFREIGIDDDQTLHNLDSGRFVSLYNGVADVSVPIPTVLSRLPDQAAPAALQPYLQLPDDLDPRVPELARKITASEPNAYRRAAAVERYLRGHYAYTLRLPATTPADPVADFLFRRRRGHCEYFASAMAVMLRTLGIPSRIVTGFRGGEFNQISDNYIVRASNAHSWVEAYIPGAGWLTFDPTPAGGAAPAGVWDRAQFYLDAAHEFWREWIVNYDAGHQQALSLAAVRQTRSHVSRLRRWTRDEYHRMLGEARRLHLAASRHPRRLLRDGAILLSLLGLAALPLGAFRLRQMLRERSPRISPASAATISYLRMSRHLARRGYRRASGQTPAEFADAIGDEPLREAVVRFTAAYQQARFGGSSDEAAALPELYDELRKLSSRS